jgi:DNA invertase Pin-like site-specific DNA recombinase
MGDSQNRCEDIGAAVQTGAGREASGARSVCLYARAPTRESDLGPEFRRLHEEAARRGWTVAEERNDHGLAGRHRAFPGVRTLVAGARAKKFSAIIVSKLAHLGQSTTNLVMTLAELAKLGAGVVALDDKVDTTEPEGPAIIEFIKVLSGFNLEIRREEGIAAARLRAAAGLAPGGRPPKYDRGAILKAFGEGRKPGEIAKLLNVPKASVKYHIKSFQKSAMEARPPL